MRRAPNHRRGFSLVEMLTVMSGCTVILTLQRRAHPPCDRTQEQTRYFFAVERTALRLADQFRQDVHHAREATTDAAALDDGAFLRLEMPGGEIVEYRSEETSILRLLRQDGDAVAREEFPLAAIGELTLRDEGSPRRLILAVSAEADDSPPGLEKRPASIREQPIRFQVEAVLSRDWRFAPADAGQEDSP